MFFDKRKYVVDISGGKGSKNTDKLRGIVLHLIVRPQSRDTVWNMTILDLEGDELLEVYDYEGRMDYVSGLPLGKDKQEKLTIAFNKVSRNEPIKVIFKTKELE